MRTIFITLLLAVAAAGSSDSQNTNGKFHGDKTSAGTVEDDDYQRVLDDTTVLDFRQKLGRMKDRLEISPQKQEVLEERLKQLKSNKRDKVNGDGDSTSEINERSGGGRELFPDDTVPTGTQAQETIEDTEKEANKRSRTKRQAYRDWRYPNTTWTNGVSYYFHPYASYETQMAFRRAAELWQRDTCIDFRYDNTAEDRIIVAPGSGNGCWSFIGKRGGEQVLLLGSGCDMVSTAAHEIGHALGFFHTMSRHDRDSHVYINTHNIRPDWRNQFDKETTDTNYNYGLPYDMGSIMHYGMTSSSANMEPSIVPHNRKHQRTMGSPFISFIDLSMINEHYNCKALCNNRTSVKCERGGFPHPRDCQKCICPGGYGGARCTQRPEGCGKTVKATKQWNTLNDTLGEWWTEREDYSICHYWIESPPNTKIEVELVYFTGNFKHDGCFYAGVEIKTNEDQTLTGYRFCATEDLGMKLLSHSNIVPIMTYNKVGVTETSLRYRYIPTSAPFAVTRSASSTLPSSTTTAGPRPTTYSAVTEPPAIADSRREFECVDSPKCPSLMKDGFCKMSFPRRTKMKICPKSCGFC